MKFLSKFIKTIILRQLACDSEFGIKERENGFTLYSKLNSHHAQIHMHIKFTLNSYLHPVQFTFNVKFIENKQ